MWTEKVFRRSVLAEGECEFLDRSMSRIRTQPLPLFVWSSGVSLLGLFLVWSLFVLDRGARFALPLCTAV